MNKMQMDCRKARTTTHACTVKGKIFYIVAHNLDRTHEFIPKFFKKLLIFAHFRTK